MRPHSALGYRPPAPKAISPTPLSGFDYEPSSLMRSGTTTGGRSGGDEQKTTSRHAEAGLCPVGDLGFDLPGVGAQVSISTRPSPLMAEARPASAPEPNPLRPRRGRIPGSALRDVLEAPPSSGSSRNVRSERGRYKRPDRADSGQRHPALRFPRGTMMSGTRSYAVDVLALALILAALAVALTKTSGLTAPHDQSDHFRDIAQAQTVRDGAPLSDQYYRDEWVWYNPLLPWTLALGSAITGTSVEVFHVRSGPWLNLLGPLAFYLLGVRLIGRTAAFIALAVYLFFAIGDGPGWAYSTYSPWLYSNDFAEGIFFTAVLALQAAADRPTLTRAGAAGALIGLTFLAHTAPALILVILACVAFARRWRMLLTTGAAAFVVASPFLYSIGLQYHFHVVNTTPLSWVWEGCAHISNVAAVPERQCGPYRFGRLRCGHHDRPVPSGVGRWGDGAAALRYFAADSADPSLPLLEVGDAAMALLAGTTLAWLCSATPVTPWAAWRQRGSSPHGVNLVAIALTVAAVVWHWPVYLDRGDLSERTPRNRNHVDAVAFLREATIPTMSCLGPLTRCEPSSDLPVGRRWLQTCTSPIRMFRFLRAHGPATACWPRSRRETYEPTTISPVSTT